MFCNESMISGVFFISSLKKIFFSFIGAQLLYNVVLVSPVQQSKSVVCIHIFPLFQISFPFRSPQSTEQGFLSYTIGSHYLSMLYTVSIVSICQSQAPSSSFLSLPILLFGIHTFKKMWYTCTMENDSARKNECRDVEMWMDIETVLQSEVSQRKITITY